MAFIGDMKNIMNYPEGLDNEPRHHVRRISCSDTILEDEDGTDEILDYARPLGAEDQEMLKWQPRTENWQNDFEVRDTQTNLSRRPCLGLCPYNNIGLSLCGKATDSDTHQERIEPQSLSSYQHGPLTIRSVSTARVVLLFWCGGLPDNRRCLQWLSHDYTKVDLSEAKPGSYSASYVFRRDVLDTTDYINDGLVATDPVTGLGINHSRPCLDPSTSDRQSDDAGKFSGVRFRKNRKSPWSAEVKPTGSKTKISVGCYQTSAAAARAVDAGRYFYNLNLDKLNFPNSLRFLDKIEVPPNLNEKALKAFVFKQAHRLAKLAEKSSSTRISETRSCNTNTGGLRNNLSANNFETHNMTPGTNVSFAGLPIARPDDFATPSMDSGRDLQANLVEVKSCASSPWGVDRIQQNLNGCVRPSTSFGSGVLREPVAPSSPEENLLLSTSNNRFTTNSQVSAGDFHLELDPTYTHEASFAPVRNSSSGKAANDLFNVLDAAWDENPEQDIPDDSARIRAFDIPSVGVSDSNILIHEIESQWTNLTFPGYDFNPLRAGSEQAEPNGDYGRDMDLFDWLDSFGEGC